MTMRRGYETMRANIAEMTTSADAGDISFEIDDAKVQKLLARDSDPMFVTIQVAREGVSKNGKNYTAETMQEIADQINQKQPDGYKGHLTDIERETKAPDPETIWLGAKVMKDKDGRTAVYAKGYVMPYAKKRRAILQTANDLGKNLAVSIFGGAKKAVYNANQKAYDIVGIVVDSVDWARPGSEGIPNDGTLVLTSEMHKTTKPKEGIEMTREEVIKDLKKEEIAEHNPTLLAEMESDAKTGLIPLSEMTALGVEKVEEVSPKLAEMTKELNGFRLNSEIDSRVVAKAARPVIKKMALAEMKQGESVADTVGRVLQSDQAKVIIKEMTGTPKVNPTNDDKSQPTARKFSKVTKK